MKSTVRAEAKVLASKQALEVV